MTAQEIALLFPLAVAARSLTSSETGAASLTAPSAPLSDIGIAEPTCPAFGNCTHERCHIDYHYASHQCSRCKFRIGFGEEFIGHQDGPDDAGHLHLRHVACPKCRICDSIEHQECGFCSRCHEHAVSTFTEDDPDDEALTACCGAVITSYDYDPT